jgi:putative flippase GtrA
LKIIKFFTSSIIVTIIDFCIYTALIQVVTATVANSISASCGMVCNFIFQRNWIFNASRSLATSFFLSLLFSCGGVALGTFLIYIMTNHTGLASSPVVAKIVSTGIVFSYNYYTKKVAFGDSEKSTI